jgi:hypothetical protein
MEELERYEQFILDNKNCKLVCTNTSVILHFDFENMHYGHCDKKTLKPIRYDIENKRILYWQTQRWGQFRGECGDAALKLFNNYCDRAVLGVDFETSNNS